ncbi:hypothetical protein WJ97_06135 [Burkholderia ubonensis]|nr:hypothetical protein WJ97_06135 [Burkholderia ubonensis]
MPQGLFVLMFESGFMCELELIRNVMPRVGVAQGGQIDAKSLCINLFFQLATVRLDFPPDLPLTRLSPPRPD